MTRTRVTISCHEAHIDDANNLAMALGFGPADGETFKTASWQDASGNIYAAASLPVLPDWITSAQSTLERPEWDAEPYTINMTGAERAQAVLVFWTPADGGTAPQASPDALTAIGGMDGLDALAAMGLERVPSEEPV